jgi:predicted nucleic acid-binding protein
VVWVDGRLHDGALDLLLERRDANLSLVDAVSFLVIRRRGVDEVFAYDQDFEREGLSLIG